MQVFDEMNSAMLILGEPGSGKTTMLLELARDCIERAHQDATRLIPVVFNLSSWNENQTIDIWLVSELSTKYNVPKKLAQNWVANDSLQLLLDGLDEVNLQSREGCVGAINNYRQRHGLTVPIAVCSRIVDYEALSRKLNLSGAVLIQPLSLQQIDEYFKQAGSELEGVYQILRDDEILQQLVKQPLMLSIMTLAYRGKSAKEFGSENLKIVAARRAHLFDAYINQMLKRTARTKSQLYTRAQATTWLSWLAHKMVQKGQVIFHIEQLQPDYLPKGFSYWQYSIIDRLSSSIFISFLIWYLTSPATDKIVWSFAGFVIVALSGQTLSFDTNRKQSFWTSLRNLLLGALIGILITTLADYSGLRNRFGFFDLIPMPIYGLAIVFAFMILGGPSLRPRRILVVETLRWSWQKAILTGLGGLIGGLVGGLSMALLILIVVAQGTDPSVGDLLIVVLPYMLAFGGLLGLGMGIRSGMVGDQIVTKTTPNQGVWQSVRNSGIGGFVMGGTTFLFFMVLPVMFMFYPASRVLYHVARIVGSGPIFIILGVCMGILAYGGAAALSHLVLRYVLVTIDAIPLNYVRFLDHCVDHIFLRRVGGGYIFIHRLLMEHFAAMYLENEK
jgi:hypothetical protein